MLSAVSPKTRKKGGAPAVCVAKEACSGRVSLHCLMLKGESVSLEAHGAHEADKV